LITCFWRDIGRYIAREYSKAFSRIYATPMVRVALWGFEISLAFLNDGNVGIKRYQRRKFALEGEIAIPGNDAHDA